MLCFASCSSPYCIWAFMSLPFQQLPTSFADASSTASTLTAGRQENTRLATAVRNAPSRRPEAMVGQSLLFTPRTRKEKETESGACWSLQPIGDTAKVHSSGRALFSSMLQIVPRTFSESMLPDSKVLDAAVLQARPLAFSPFSRHYPQET